MGWTVEKSIDQTAELEQVRHRAQQVAVGHCLIGLIGTHPIGPIGWDQRPALVR